jgi:hypothetical protein
MVSNLLAGTVFVPMKREGLMPELLTHKKT